MPTTDNDLEARLKTLAEAYADETNRMKSRNPYENGGNGGDAEEEDEP